MKKFIQIMTVIVMFAILFLFSCRKNIPVNDFVNNAPPVAIAGNEQSIMLPQDSVFLDGSASYDVEGDISRFGWKKIVGPATFIIADQFAAKTLVNKLERGRYSFELEVVDKGGLSDMDTIVIWVD